MKKATLKTVLYLLSLVPFVTYAMPIERCFVQGGSITFKEKKVVVSNFDMSKYEITNDNYAAFLNAKQIDEKGILKEKLLINIASPDLLLEFKNKKWQPKKGFQNYPVVMVNYYGAVAFCNWAGGRLPTEVEWIYAAKGGKKSKNYTFSGGNTFQEVGWFKNNSQNQAHEVGKKKPNELGIYDLSGNVWEWCLNDSLKSDSDFCVHKGGSWYAEEQPGRIDARYGNTPLHFSNSVGFRILFPDESVTILQQIFKNYKGKPWNNQPQQIPGKVQCELYDLGGQNIAYFDKDSINNGSGKLNPANGTFLNEFRLKEGVDISYTKSRDIDNSPYNVVEPLIGELYTGWTVPGEWINYTVKVSKTGTYSVEMMYTASGDGGIAFLLDWKAISSEILIPSTRNDNETIAWRQWHHWNKINILETVKLKKGMHILTLKTVTNGNMNYDYLEFRLDNSPKK